MVTGWGREGLESERGWYVERGVRGCERGQNVERGFERGWNVERGCESGWNVEKGVRGYERGWNVERSEKV